MRPVRWFGRETGRGGIESDDVVGQTVGIVEVDDGGHDVGYGLGDAVAVAVGGRYGDGDGGGGISYNLLMVDGLRLGIRLLRRLGRRLIRVSRGISGSCWKIRRCRRISRWRWISRDRSSGIDRGCCWISCRWCCNWGWCCCCWISGSTRISGSSRISGGDGLRDPVTGAWSDWRITGGASGRRRRRTVVIGGRIGGGSFGRVVGGRISRMCRISRKMARFRNEDENRRRRVHWADERFFGGDVNGRRRFGRGRISWISWCRCRIVVVVVVVVVVVRLRISRIAGRCGWRHGTRIRRSGRTVDRFGRSVTGARWAVGDLRPRGWILAGQRRSRSCGRVSVGCSGRLVVTFRVGPGQDGPKQAVGRRRRQFDHCGLRFRVVVVVCGVARSSTAAGQGQQ